MHYISLGDLKGPRSAGSKSRGSAQSSQKSLTPSELKEALRRVIDDLTKDLMQEIRARLVPLIPPSASHLGMGASFHRIQASHLVAGPTHTLAV